MHTEPAGLALMAVTVLYLKDSCPGSCYTCEMSRISLPWGQPWLCARPSCSMRHPSLI